MLACCGERDLCVACTSSPMGCFDNGCHSTSRIHTFSNRSGEIKRWDDPAIAALNPELAQMGVLTHNITYVVRTKHEEPERKLYFAPRDDNYDVLFVPQASLSARLLPTRRPSC